MSGGFATVQPGSAMSINAAEGYPLEDFSADAIRSQIAEAQKVANGSGSEQDIAEAKIELEVRSRNPHASSCRRLLMRHVGPRDSGCSCEIDDVASVGGHCTSKSLTHLSTKPRPLIPVVMVLAAYFPCAQSCASSCVFLGGDCVTGGKTLLVGSFVPA